MLRGLHGQSGEIRARSAGFEFRKLYFAGWIYVDSDCDPYGALNGISRAWGDIRQDSLDYLAGGRAVRRRMHYPIVFRPEGRLRRCYGSTGRRLVGGDWRVGHR